MVVLEEQKQAFADATEGGERRSADGAFRDGHGPVRRQAN